jgi:hypothetical protein
VTTPEFSSANEKAWLDTLESRHQKFNVAVCPAGTTESQPREELTPFRMAWISEKKKLL